MRVVLLERVPKLGGMGDTVEVKTGYARNFLLPQKMALRATVENLKIFQARKAELEANNLKTKAVAEGKAEKLAKVSIVLIRQASEIGYLYGSVRPGDIAESLAEQGFDIKKAQINIAAPIKTVGTYRIGISLHPEVTAEVSLRVMTAQEQSGMFEQSNEENEALEDNVAEREDDGIDARV